MLKEKVESIDKMIEEWVRQSKASARRFEEIKEGRLNEYSRVWMDYLADDFPFDNTHIRMHDGRVEIHRDVDDRNRRELMTVYFREDWETKEFTELNTSVYSSSENSQWELERLTTVGAVANVLLNHYDDILTALNTIKAEWSENYINAYSDVGRAGSMIYNWQNEKNKMYLDHAEKLLMSEGLTFTDELGSFELLYDQYVNSIKTIKVTNVSASGKTCTVEVEQYWSYRDQIEKRTYEKVRVSKLNSLYWQYRDYVLLAEKKEETATHKTSSG
jgi:hypothetical protein